MPLPIAHGLLGASIVAAIHPHPAHSRWRVPLFVGAFLANCPDADFLLVGAFHDKSWHRAFTHSLVFALVVGLLMLAYFGRSRLREAVAYGLAFASHGVLDFITTKFGGGVKLLWPFSQERFKLGVIGLSEIPSRLLPTEVLRALLIEFAIFAPLLLATLLVSRRFQHDGNPSPALPVTKEH